MPMITLKIAHPEADTLVNDAAELAVSLTARVFGKDRDLTTVAVELVPPERWFVAGRSLVEHGRAGFFLETRVTAGTNTKDEKAKYIAQAFAAYQALLGELHPESYVAVVEMPADAYGHAGLTQERRYIERQPHPPAGLG